MGVHACGHVGLFPGAAVWVPLSQMCDGSITGVSEKRKQEMSFFFKKGCAPFNARLPSGHLSRRHRPNGDELCGV